MAGLHLLVKTIKDSKKSFRKAHFNIRETNKTGTKANNSSNRLSEALLGHISLDFISTETMVLKADYLNLLTGGKKVASSLAMDHDLDHKIIHNWLNKYETQLSLVNTLSGGQAASVVPATVEFVKGVARSTLILDTDAGSWPTGAKSTGRLNIVAGSALVDGDWFPLIGNGKVGGVTQKFEYRADGGAAAEAGARVIAYDAGDTADEVAVKTATEINTVRNSGVLLRIKSTAGTAKVDLEQDIPGTDGDTAIDVTNVTDIGFTSFAFGDVGNSMTAGAGDKIEITGKVESAAGANDNKVPFLHNKTIGPAVCRIVVW